MNELPGLLDAIKALGVAGGPVFAVLWWLERSERRACQAEMKGLLTQALTVASQSANSVTEVTKVVADGARDSVASMAQLGQLVRSLIPRRRGDA